MMPQFSNEYKIIFYDYFIVYKTKKINQHMKFFRKKFKN